MLIEISTLKNYPSTNLNRDETGAPKSMVFGGVERGRISSQSIKRAVRQSKIFKNALVSKLGTRTRKIGDLVIPVLKELGVDESYFTSVVNLLSGLGTGDKKSKKDESETEEANGTSQLMFYSIEDKIAIGKAIKTLIEEKGSVKEFSKVKVSDLEKMLKDADVRPITLDIALFGRMPTSPAFKIVDASVQVAHAMGVNKLVKETDFFTAVDDLMPNGGAAMIGDIEYNSTCYYQYFNLDTDQLLSNLKYSEYKEEEINIVIGELIKAYLYSNPSGKQGSFAGHVVPEVVLVEIKENKIPVNYANAFVTPSRPENGKNLVENSVIKLVNEVNIIDKKYCLPLIKRFWLDLRDIQAPNNCEAVEDINNLVEGIINTLKK